MYRSGAAKPITVEGTKYPSRKEACKAYGVNYKTYLNKCAEGFDPVGILLNPPKDSTKKTWTEAEVAILKRFASSKTAEEIGIILGRPTYSVSGKAVYAGISLKKVGENHRNSKLSDLQVLMVHILCDAGFTPTEIQNAAMPHVTVDTLNDIKFGRTHKE